MAIDEGGPLLSTFLTKFGASFRSSRLKVKVQKVEKEVPLFDNK